MIELQNPVETEERILEKIRRAVALADGQLTDSEFGALSVAVAAEITKCARFMGRHVGDEDDENLEHHYACTAVMLLTGLVVRLLTE